jgi:hypothetical protein
MAPTLAESAISSADILAERSGLFNIQPEYRVTVVYGGYWESGAPVDVGRLVIVGPGVLIGHWSLVAGHWSVVGGQLSIRRRNKDTGPGRPIEVGLTRVGLRSKEKGRSLQLPRPMDSRLRADLSSRARHGSA